MTAIVLLALSGCMFRQLKENLQDLGQYGVLRGTVSVDHATDAAIIVLVYGGEGASTQVIDSFVLAQPGAFFFIIPAGTYRLAAFEDRDRTFAYDPAHDPVARHADGRPLTVAPGQIIEHLDLMVTAQGEPLGFGYTVPEGGRRGAHELPAVNVGVVTTLDDPRFSHDNARLGLWQPVDFLFDVGAGLYFLEPYDPKKTPVLFIHGAMGTPDDWRTIIAHLDRSRFQPWLLYYPTALHLTLDGQAIDRWMQRLYSTYRFSRLLVVAHSMGGLVGRSFINSALQNPSGGVAESLHLFITLSTPWQGQSDAALGAEHAPVAAPSWFDIAPGSPFLQWVQAQPLPKAIPHYLLFSYGGGGRFSGEPNDGVVTLASQLDPRAQAESVKVYGFDDSHTDILADPSVSALLNEILAAAAQ